VEQVPPKRYEEKEPSDEVDSADGNRKGKARTESQVSRQSSMSLAARIDSEVGHVIDLPIDEFWPKERAEEEGTGVQHHPSRLR